MPIQAPTSVYLYRDSYGILIYVGITSRGIQRNREHNTDKDWWSLVASQEVEHFDTRTEAEFRERELIERHMPPFNTQHNRNREASRQAYLTFLASQAVRVPLPEAIAALPGRRIDLELHEASDPHCILRTRAEDAQIAMALALDEPVRAFGMSKATNVNMIEQVGPFALLHTTRRLKDPFLDAHAIVKCDVKRPTKVARLKVVQLRIDREAAA